MIKSVVSKLLRWQEVFAIDLNNIGADQFEVNITQVSVDKNEEFTISPPRQMDNFDALLSFLDEEKTAPIVLNISGKGVLNKKITENWETEEELLRYIMPNNESSSDAFLVQHTTAKDGTIVSLMRNNSVEDLLEIFGSHSHRIIRMSAGMPILGYLELLSLREVIHQPTYTVLFNSDAEIEGIALEGGTGQGGDTSDAIVEKENIYGVNVKGVLTAISLINESANGAYEQPKEVIRNNSEFSQQKLFKILGPALLAISFGALLINFIVFTQASSKNMTIAEDYDIQNSILKEYEQKHDELKKKQNVIKKLGIKGKDNLSIYADRIGASVPKRIALSRLVIAPMEIDKRKGTFTILGDKIMVAGTSTTSSEFSNWLVELKNEPWIAGISDEKYEFSGKYKRGAFSFSIRLNGNE